MAGHQAEAIIMLTGHSMAGAAV